MKRGNRLNPAAMLDSIYTGQVPDSADLARVLSELGDSQSSYDKPILIKILARANSRKAIPAIRVCFLASDDPFAVHEALSALFRWWSEDPKDPMYCERIQALAAGMDWDPDELVAQAARTL